MLDIHRSEDVTTVIAALGIVIAIFGAIAGITSFHPFDNLATLLALSVVVLVGAIAAKLRA
jgi:hypothetical protein